MTTIIFNSINAQNIAQAGVNCLNARQNKSIIMEGNLECVDYRKSVYPELRVWMKDVFQYEEYEVISAKERIELFTFIRGKAVEGIIAYREKNTVDQTAVALEEANARIAELEAKVANQSKQLKLNQEALAKRNKQIKSLKVSANSLNKTIQSI